MSKFKVGDKVKFIGKEIETPYLRNEIIYTVDKINQNKFIQLKEIYNEHLYDEDRFELVEEYTPMQAQPYDIPMFKHITDEMFETYKKKNTDYGNSFSELFSEYGLTSSCIRLEDKLKRLKRLTKNENQVKDESIEDTLLDMANYAIMTVMELRKGK